MKPKQQENKDFIEIGNLFNMDITFSQAERLNAIAKPIVDGETKIGILKGHPKKHYKKISKIEKLGGLYHIFNPDYPVFANCLRMRCENIAECWSFKKGKLKGENKFKSFICRYQDILDRNKRRKILFDKSVKSQSKKFSTLSEFERDLIIASLRLTHFRDTQFKEIIKKLEDSNYLVIK